MADIAEIVLCPRCRGEMKWEKNDLLCDCGWRLELSDGFFKMKDEIKREVSCAEFYNEEYYNSDLYDYTGYRLNRILSLARAGEDRRILDLGCGPGEIAVRCAKRGAEVYGIDVSKDALRLSVERSAREGVVVNLFEFDGENLPFKDAIFDSIILSDVVEHVKDDTLSLLLRESARVLRPEGWLIIHTSPTKNIIYLTKMLKILSLGMVDLHSRLINPDYEFLHVRYHSMRSLRRLLKRILLHPVMWGEARYLADSKLVRILGRLGLGEILSDQIWCVALKDAGCLKRSGHITPLLSLIEPMTDIDLGNCDDLYLNYGFYESELDSFRWTRKRCSLYINVPEDRDHLEIEVQTSNPGAAYEPVRVDIHLGDRKISGFSLSDMDIKVFRFDIDEEVTPGMKELRLEVDRTFVPKELGINDDPRELGVAIYRVSIL